MGECSTRSPKLEWSTTSVDDFIGLNLIEIRDREARLAVSKWFCDLVKHIQDDQAKFCDKKTFMGSSFKRQNLKSMLAKLFAGKDWEQKVLRGLSLGRRISCCIALVPRQLQEIYDHGLSEFFATKLNQILPEWAIPEWIEGRVKSIASESHKGNEFALGFLADLKQYFSTPPSAACVRSFEGALGNLQDGWTNNAWNSTNSQSAIEATISQHRPLPQPTASQANSTPCDPVVEMQTSNVPGQQSFSRPQDSTWAQRHTSQYRPTAYPPFNVPSPSNGSDQRHTTLASSQPITTDGFVNYTHENINSGNSTKKRRHNALSQAANLGTLLSVDNSASSFVGRPWNTTSTEVPPLTFSTSSASVHQGTDMAYQINNNIDRISLAMPNIEAWETY